MGKWRFHGLATAVLIFLSASALAQASHATYERDWTVDGTRDRLLSTAQRLFGDDAAFYISLPREEADRELVANQFAFAFHGVPEREIDLASGHKLFVGADPDSIREKALVLTDADRATIRALAIVHRSCGGKQRREAQTGKFTTCPRATTLTFFVRDGEPLAPQPREEVTQWVRAEARRYNDAVKQQALATGRNFVKTIDVEVKAVRAR